MILYDAKKKEELAAYWICSVTWRVYPHLGTMLEKPAWRSNLYIRRHENLKSYKILGCLMVSVKVKFFEGKEFI